MPFNFAQARVLARQTIHEVMAVQAWYQDASMSKPVAIAARWTVMKNALVGDIDHEGYARSLEAVDRIVLAQADSKAVGVKRTGILRFDAPYSVAFVLVQKSPNDGPYDETWQVQRQ